jgi:hypothetical protein
VDGNAFCAAGVAAFAAVAAFNSDLEFKATLVALIYRNKAGLGVTDDD